MSTSIDIGHGVTIRFFEARNPDPGPFYVRAGLIEEHSSAAAQTGRCQGVVHFRGRPGANDDQPTWEVIREEPLTLAPSLRCRTCGHHGHIIDGRWVPA